MCCVVSQAISSLERKLKQHAANEKASGQDDKQTLSVPVDPQIYCVLGHLNLLLENYPKGITVCVNVNLNFIWRQFQNSMPNNPADGCRTMIDRLF